MKISIKEYRDIKILYMEGDLKDSYATTIEDRLDRILELAGKVICDMERVTSIGPHVLDIFSLTIQKMRSRNSLIKFAGIGPLRTSFHRAGIDDDVLFCENLQQGIAAMQGFPPDPHAHTTIKAEHINTLSLGETGAFDDTTAGTNEKNIHRALSLYAKVHKANATEKVESLTLEEIKRAMFIYSQLQEKGLIEAIEQLSRKYQQPPEKIACDLLQQGLTLYNKLILPFWEEYHGKT